MEICVICQRYSKFFDFALVKNIFFSKLFENIKRLK